MRVDLGRGDVGVSEEILDDSEIRTPCEQMCGEGMPEHVRMDVLEPGLGRPMFHNLPDADTLDGTTRS